MGYFKAAHFREYTEKRIQEINPYKQLILDRKINQTLEILNEYITYITTINITNFDMGIGFLKKLEDRLKVIIKNVSILEFDGYMRDIHNETYHSLNEIIKEFKKFILK